MNGQQAIAFGIVGLTLVMLVWGRWRYDVIAVLALLAVVFGGLVPPRDAFAGFAHPAVITVAAVLIISRGLQNAGLVDAVVKAVGPLRGRPGLQITAQCAVIAILSGFMNNVGALALMLPVALRNAYRDGYSPGRSLMPLAFASLLGGLTTLIGTPPNIIIAGFRAQTSGQAFGMFDFFPVGVAVAVVGLLFLALAGRFLVPVRSQAAGPGMAFSIKGYIAEAQVPPDAPAVGKAVFELEEMAGNDITIAAIIQAGYRRLVPAGYERVGAGDVLVLRGDTESLKSFIDSAGLKLGGGEAIEREDLQSDDIELVEAIVSPGSSTIGRTPASLRLRTVFGLNLFAIARQGHRIDERLSHVVVRSGDVMLLQGPRRDLSKTLTELGLLPLAERSLDLGRRQRLAMAATIFAASILLILSEVLPAHIAFTAAAAGFVVTDLVKTSEIYAAVDWPVVVLLGALFPVASALDTSGATTLMAEAILNVTEAQGPVLTLVVLLVATMFISDLINNNATALLMAPIAITLATRLGVSADPFLMAVAIGASCAFLTPIGHQSNALVMEPGGYQFGDYWRVGLPLEFIIVLVAVPVLLTVWPM